MLLSETNVRVIYVLYLASLLVGVTAIVVKEVRGRMRGRRAFIALTVYLMLLAGFEWMIEHLISTTVSSCLGCGDASWSAAAGQGMFVAMLMLQALLVAVPVMAFIQIYSLPETFGVVNYLGFEIIFGKVDKLTFVFLHVFTLMAIIGCIYGLHVEETGQHIAAFLYVAASLGVTLAGDYLLAHENEILDAVKHIEARSRLKNPLGRIMEISQEKAIVTIATTEDKLAQKLGREIYKAHKGELHYQWSHDQDLVRVNWRR